MAFSEKNLCIRCNKGDNVLICGENGCPLAIHEGCMGCQTRFDDAGRFYCPYCWYKQAVAESHRAREYALVKRKSLMIFMDGGVTCSRKRSEENKGSELVNDHNQLENRVVNEDMTLGDHDKTTEIRDGVLYQSIHLGDGQNICNAEEEVQNAETSGSTSACSTGQVPALENANKSRIANSEEEVQKAEVEASERSKDQDPALESDDKWKIGNVEGQDKEIKENEIETSAGSFDEEHSDKTHKEEKLQEEEFNIVSPQTRSRAKRGFEKTSPAVMENPKATPAQNLSGKRPLPSATPSRRSRRLSFESQK